MRLLVIIATAAFATSAIAQDQPKLTVEQCITILSGLNTLNCAGQQLGGSCAPDAKQYKLGDARYTIGANIQALTPVLTTYQRAQQQFMAELPTIPDYDHGTADHPKPAPPEVLAMVTDQNKKSLANQVAMLAKSCNVVPGHLKLQELKLGDDPDHNAIPPSVLGAISAIIDR